MMASISHQMRLLEDIVERMEYSKEVLDSMQAFAIIEPSDTMADVGDRIHAFGVMLKRFTLLLYREMHGREAKH